MNNLSKFRIIILLVGLTILVLSLHIIGLFTLKGYAAATIINISTINIQDIKSEIVYLNNDNKLANNIEEVNTIQKPISKIIVNSKITLEKINNQNLYPNKNSVLPNIDIKLSQNENIQPVETDIQDIIQNLNQDGDISDSEYTSLQDYNSYLNKKALDNYRNTEENSYNKPIIQNISQNIANLSNLASNKNESDNDNLDKTAKNIKSATHSNIIKSSLDFPKSQELKYQLLFNHIPSRKGSIIWNFDGNNYTAKFATSVVLFGDIIFESIGKVTPNGLTPTMYKRISGKKQYITTFDIENKKVHFSRNNQTKDMPEDVKDFTSVAFQIMAMVRKNPPKEGLKYQFNVATDDDIQIWDIVCNGLEKVNLDEDNSTQAWHFTRIPRYNGDKRKVEWWLEPSNNWLIAKLKQTEPNGTEFEFIRTN